MLLRKFAILFILAVMAAPLFAAESAVKPDQLIRETVDTVILKIEQDKAAFQRDQAELYAFVDQTVLPHFDFERMSKWVLGKYWRQFSDAQQAQFVQEFRQLLVRTYSLALLEYNGHKVNVSAADISTERGTSVVKTEVVQSGAPPVSIDYSLYLADDQHWKVYDVVIEGISLVANYRSSFGTQVKNSGPEGLLKYLVDKNKG